MAQINFDWVTGVFGNLAAPAAGMTFVMPALAQSNVSFVFVLIGQAELEAKEDSLRVERVVGSVHHLFARSSGGLFPGQGCGLVERIYVTELDTNDTPLVHSLDSEVDFDREWFWERVGWLPDSTFYEGGGNQKQQWATERHVMSPYWRLVDLGRKARLRNRDVLVYHAQFQGDLNYPFVEDDTFFCVPRLRVGVRF